MKSVSTGDPAYISGFVQGDIDAGRAEAAPAKKRRHLLKFLLESVFLLEVPYSRQDSPCFAFRRIDMRICCQPKLEWPKNRWYYWFFPSVGFMVGTACGIGMNLSIVPQSSLYAPCF